MYTGPTNSGVYPSSDAIWGYWQDGAGDWISLNPLSASKNGLDGRTSKGSVDDYWEEYDAGGGGYHDPWYGNWVEHTYEGATGDYMYTNQWEHGYENSDGATPFYSYDTSDPLYCATLEYYADYESNPSYLVDGTLGLSKFYESRGYSIDECFYQNTDNLYPGGFSFADYKAIIDSGRPVMLHLEGHTVVGTGYNDSTTPPTIYLNDTWSYVTQSMDWGGIYEGMAMVGVSVVHVTPLPPSNDDFSNAKSVASPNLIELNTGGATNALDDPEIEDCDLNAGTATVWYQYTHEDAATSALSFDTETSNYDTFIAVWTGDRGSLELVTCNDDIDNSNENYQSQVAFQVKNGETYYIEVGEWNGSYGASATSASK